MTVIVFPSRSLADTVLNEIAVTPDIEDGIGSVAVWWDPDGPTNTIVYAESTDGRVAISHHWSSVDREWLEIYLSNWPDVIITDELPSNWQWESD